MLDVGLLAAMSGVSAKAIIHGDELFQEARESLMENFVNQELIQTYKTYYWTSEGKAEIDFTFQEEGHVFPVEVKSGSSNKKKSLLSYNEKYHPKMLIRTSPMNLKKENNLLNCPLYLVGSLRKIINIPIIL